MKRIHVPTLVIGLACFTVGVLGMASHVGDIPLALTRNLLAGALVAAGITGLIVALRYRREDHH